MLGPIFQFIAANNKSLSKIISGPAVTNCNLIIDLEDALKNVLFPSQTANLKQAGRRNVLRVFQTTKVENQNIGIRINALNSEEFEKDILFLAQIKKSFFWKYIVVPKVESQQDILYYKGVLARQEISYKELIPIVETISGAENLTDILKVKDLFTHCFWGHHDYNFDADKWPFFEHQHKEYWDITTPLIQKLTAANINYINSPVSKFENDCLVKSIFFKLDQLCGGRFGQSAISYQQVKKFTFLRETNYFLQHSIKQLNIVDVNEKIQLAKITINSFEARYNADTSFSFNLEEQLFISPHQYFSAKRFLEEILVC